VPRRERVGIVVTSRQCCQDVVVTRLGATAALFGVCIGACGGIAAGGGEADLQRDAGAAASGGASSDAGAGTQGGSAGACGDSVQFVDAALERAVRDAVSQPDGPLTSSALRSIQYLSVFEPLSSLEGIQCLVGLRNLYVDPGNLSTLEPLAALQLLEGADFPGNKISDLTPLNDKPTLRSLGASLNQVEDVSNLRLNAQDCGFLLLDHNPLNDAAAEDLARFCAAGWYVAWGEPPESMSCNMQCVPRP